MTMAYAIAFGAALVLALVLTPAVIRLSRHWKLYDPHNWRKVHDRPVSRTGGVAIVLSMLTVGVAVMLLDPGRVFSEPTSQFTPADLTGKLIVLFATSFFIFLVGVIDDVRDVRAVVKLLAQIAAACVVRAYGIGIHDIGLFGVNFSWLGWPITIIWIVGITNAVNLIDGLDGLSAGICAATCAVIAAFAIFTGQQAMAILMLILLGSLAGFLVFNFNPAKIFMGDSGSMFLGFFLATASMVSQTKVATVMGLLLPTLALGLPIFDMLLTVLRRMLARQSIFAPDSGHVHHRLLDRGLKHHHVVILLYLVTLLVAGAGLLMMVFRGGGEVLIFVIALLVLLTVFRIAGVLQFRRMWEQVRDNLVRGQTIRRERRHYQAIRDQFRSAKTYATWWRAARRMARRMQFEEITVQFQDDATGQLVEKTYRNEAANDAPAMRMTIPIVACETTRLRQVEIAVPVDEPLETLGRRISLFGRLLDEYAVIGTEDETP